MKKSLNAVVVAAFFVLGGFLIYSNWKTSSLDVQEPEVSSNNLEEPARSSQFVGEFVSDSLLNELQELKAMCADKGIDETIAFIDSDSRWALIKKEVGFYIQKEHGVAKKQLNLVRDAADSLFMYSGHWSMEDKTKSDALMNEARLGYRFVSKNDSLDVHSLGQLALIYFYHDGAPMRGVMKFREILDIDSNNEFALYQLGLLSVQSGQLEKAKMRFEKLVSLHPLNSEYQMQLAEVQELLNKE